MNPFWIRLLAIGILLATFLAGGLAGIAFERAVGDESAALRVGARGLGGRPPNIFAPGSPLAEQLDLTPQQVEEIEAVLEADRAKARATFEEIEPRLRARLDSTTAAIRTVLTAEQQAEFDRIIAERRQRMRERSGNGAGGGARVGRGGRHGGVCTTCERLFRIGTRLATASADSAVAGAAGFR